MKMLRLKPLPLPPASTGHSIIVYPNASSWKLATKMMIQMLKVERGTVLQVSTYYMINYEKYLKGLPISLKQILSI